jgi:hypothetical protein
VENGGLVFAAIPGASNKLWRSLWMLLIDAFDATGQKRSRAKKIATA